jgi:NTE family protein
MNRRTFMGAVSAMPMLAAAAPIAGVTPAASVAAQKSTSKKAAVRKVGIAFGGGSTHGIAHLGVLKALAEKGVKFDFIAGTSAGAIVGILAAAQMPLSEIDLLARRIEWPGLLSLTWSGRGLMQNSKLRSLIDSALGERRIEQLPIPFGAVTTDLASGQRVLIRKGPAGPAVEASSSIPVFFSPTKIDGRELVDGGLTEPVPVLAVREMGANIVIGVDVAFRPNEDQFQGLTGVAFQTMHIMGNALINEQIRHADLAIRMNVHAMIGKEKSHEQLVAAGYAETMRAWPTLSAMVSG